MDRALCDGAALMQPQIALDEAIVGANARAWREFAGVPLWAVVKGDGYGWGVGRIVRAVGDVSAGFFVSDEEELRELRRHTAAPTILLGAVPAERLAAVLQLDATPTISTHAELDFVREAARSRGRRPCFRIGLRPAAAWGGVSLSEMRVLAAYLAQDDADVEVWSHVTDWEHRAEQLEQFEEALRIVRAAGARVCSSDIASTFTLAAEGARGTTRVRVGIGLFGATGGQSVPGVRCALRVDAPLVRTERLAEEMRIGYGSRTLSAGETIAVARCGYADGLPRSLAGWKNMLSVGMQYLTLHVANARTLSSPVSLLDEHTDLDALAAGAGLLPHEIVTRFGNSACARAAAHPSR
ncbi:MAG: alanine racemase [Vulcanimicrobiaceae bacterium]